MHEDAQATKWLASVSTSEHIAICTVTRGEILFGLERLAAGRRRTDLESKAHKLFDVLPCEPILREAGDRYANLKATQQQRGLSLDENDLWIAATALLIGATLVTRDSDFQRIAGLKVLAP